MSDHTDLMTRLREHAENMYVDFLNHAADALEAQAKRIAELEAALKPFADAADEYEGLGVQNKDRIFVPFAACRQARKVLGEK